MAINAKNDPSSLYEAVTAANVITAAESGKTFGLSLAGGFASTLPTAAKGLKYKFVVKIAPTTAYTIGTAGAANLINGQVCSAEDAAGSVVTAAASDIVNFVANKAIVGDWVELECVDGTNWEITGMCNVQDAITTVQTA